MLAGGPNRWPVGRWAEQVARWPAGRTGGPLAGECTRLHQAQREDCSPRRGTGAARHAAQQGAGTTDAAGRAVLHSTPARPEWLCYITVGRPGAPQLGESPPHLPSRRHRHPDSCCSSAPCRGAAPRCPRRPCRALHVPGGMSCDAQSSPSRGTATSHAALVRAGATAAHGWQHPTSSFPDPSQRRRRTSRAESTPPGTASPPCCRRSQQGRNGPCRCR